MAISRIAASLSNRLVMLGEKLTRPSATLQPSAKRQARTLASVMLGFLPVLILATFVSLPIALAGTGVHGLLEHPLVYLGLGTIAAVLVAYGLSRTRYFMVSAVILVSGLMVAIYIATITSPIDLTGHLLIVHWLAFVLLLGGLFLTIPTLIVLSLVMLIAVATLPWIDPAFTFSNISGPATFIVAVAIYVIAARNYQNTLEAQRHQLLTDRQAELERRVAERTVELEAMNEDLVYLSRVKDEFVANVSHELRTPIASIKLFHDLIAARPERAADYVDTMRRETSRLEHTIENLLSLSRFDLDNVDLRLASVDLNALVGDMVADRMALAASRDLTLVVNQADDLPSINADPHLLGQALSILLTNAFTYTPVGGQVTVQTYHRRRGNGSEAGVSVSDTGPGIPLDEQPHLFKRFFRGRLAQTSGAQGTGLGLAIVKTIAGRHRAVVEVVSEGFPGKGATFTLWFPV